MRVLVVDEDPYTAIDMAEELVKAGHEVFGPVNNRAEALVTAEEKRPDVVLLDIALGSLGNGIELGEQLQKLDIPILITSAHSTEARKHSALAMGYLAKPFDATQIPTIFEVVGEVLAGQVPALDTLPSSLELFTTY